MTTPVSALPSLENGDHLDREEFHRRYEARPDIRRAELVEGVVHVASPVRFEPHDRPALLCGGILLQYESLHEGVAAGQTASLILDSGNEVQADGFLFRESGDGARRDERGYIRGAPELVIEVSASTASYDLHEKKEAYRRNGVLEYMVWRVLDGAIDVFWLDDGEYVSIKPGPDGIIESREFPGLRFNIPAMLAGRKRACLEAIR